MGEFLSLMFDEIPLALMGVLAPGNWIMLLIRKTEYLEKTLYHAYYAFESLYHRKPEELVCGICGVSPDILFGKTWALLELIVKIITTRRRNGGYLLQDGQV